MTAAVGGGDGDTKIRISFDRLCTATNAEFAAYIAKIRAAEPAKKLTAIDAMAAVCRAGLERWSEGTVASALRVLRRYVSFDGNAGKVIGDLTIFLPASQTKHRLNVEFAELVQNFIAETIAKFPHSTALENMIALTFRGWLTPELAVDVSAWIALASPSLDTAKLLLNDVVDRSVFHAQNLKPRPTKWTALRGDASPLGKYLAALNFKVRWFFCKFCKIFLNLPKMRAMFKKDAVSEGLIADFVSDAFDGRAQVFENRTINIIKVRRFCKLP